jgi:hypothetical protein
MLERGALNQVSESAALDSYTSMAKRTQQGRRAGRGVAMAITVVSRLARDES